LSEIPEYLLKKSREAKAAKLGLDMPETSDAPSKGAEASASTAVTKSSPADDAIAALTADLPYLEAKSEPEKQVPEYVKAAQNRKKIPIWAMPVVAVIPVWAFGFAGTMQQPETEDALLIGALETYEVSGGCAGCHGGDGGGGSGYKLSEGEVLETFPEPIDQMVHVARGSAAITGQEYGAPRADGTRRVAGAKGNMPAQENAMSLEHLEMVIYHERAILSDEDETLPGYEEWVEHMHEAAEAGTETEIDLEFLLSCANPEITPGATGEGSPDPENQPCPGPHAEEKE